MWHRPENFGPRALDPDCQLEQETVRVPLTRDRGYQWRVQVEVNGVTGTFILDTGADATIITPRFAERAGVLEAAKMKRFNSRESGPVKAQFANLNSLRMGGAYYLRFYAPIVDLDHISRALGTNVDGIVGNNVLNKTPYRIDGGESVLTLASRSAPPPTNAIPVSVRHNRIYLKAFVNGVATEFALDTGAYRSLLAKRELGKLQIPENKRREMEAPEIDIRGSRISSQTEVRLDSFQVAEIVRTNFPILIWDQSALGMDVLSSCTLRADARRGWISLSQP
jgi:predicted aspartyl protease